MRDAQPTAMRKLTAIVSGAFLDYWIPSAAFLILTGLWCYTRKRFWLYFLPVTLLLGLYSVVHGYPHHHGTVFIAVITALWIAWPTGKEAASFGKRDRALAMGITALMLCLVAVNMWDALVVIHREYLYPYSGSLDAARYLKTVGADHGDIFGYLFGITAIQAYFDHNIVGNIPHAYYHHGLPILGDWIDIDDLHRINPEYIVAYSAEPEAMAQVGIPEFESYGYRVVHFSDGYYLYKRAVYQRESYFILRRVHPTSEQTPQPSNPDK